MDEKKLDFSGFFSKELFKDDIGPEESRVISIVVPQSYKERFDILQARSDKGFGKDLKIIIMQAIDFVDK